ncbi:preprotein translocase subunit SecE [Mesomycoplasma conjunctivae]|nr:preprotein translocase subunit SecE [Mesomycoplasma conjunctivae]
MKLTKKTKNNKKKYYFRLFWKEMKRVKWPSGSFTFKSYGKVILFNIVLMVIFFIIVVVATLLWNRTGVGF